MKKINYYLRLLKRKDLYTYLHSLRVGYYSFLIGMSMNLSTEQLNKLKKASLLHDIGKLYIPTNILNKKQPLTDIEFNIIKNHTMYAAEILNDDYKDIINDIISHHERLDGSGYPFHRKKISLNAQIIATADSFDAMTSNRGYNRVISCEEAFIELFRCSEKGMYNKKLVEKFYEKFNYQLHISRQKTKHC